MFFITFHLRSRCINTSIIAHVRFSVSMLGYFPSFVERSVIQIHRIICHFKAEKELILSIKQFPTQVKSYSHNVNRKFSMDILGAQHILQVHMYDSTTGALWCRQDKQNSILNTEIMSGSMLVKLIPFTHYIIKVFKQFKTKIRPNYRIRSVML